MHWTSLDEGEWNDRFTYIKMVPFNLGPNIMWQQPVFQVVKFLAGAKIEDHYHEWTREVFFVHEGEGTLTIDGDDFPMAPGSMFYIEPNDAHAIEAKTDLTIVIFKPHEKADDIRWGRSPRLCV